MVRTRLPLLEAIVVEMRCDYLSDLRFLGRRKRIQLADKLEKLAAEEVSLEEWNQALCYLENSQPKSDVYSAKQSLIELLLVPKEV